MTFIEEIILGFILALLTGMSTIIGYAVKTQLESNKCVVKLTQWASDHDLIHKITQK